MYILLAEILIVSALLLIGYRLLLERRTDFSWCRLYLVVLPLLSVVIPLLEIPLWPAKAGLMPVITIGEGGAVAAAEVVTEQAPVITLAGVLLSLYCMGVAALVVLLVYQFWRIRKLERDAEVGYVDGVRIVRTSVAVASFSFFRTIYVNRNTSAEDLAVIIKHECSHIAHRHSYERLAMELQKALLWWNPFVWMAARLLTEVEEFEADRDVLCGGEDRTIYIQTIFKQMFGYSPEIANSLRDSLTKKRMKMMTNKSKNSYALLRKMAIVPMIMVLVVVFGTTARATQYVDSSENEQPSIASDTTKSNGITLRMMVMPEGVEPLYLVDGKLVESILDIDESEIAYTSFKMEGQSEEELKKYVEGSSYTLEDVKTRGVVFVRLKKSLSEEELKALEEKKKSGNLYTHDSLNYNNRDMLTLYAEPITTSENSSIKVSQISPNHVQIDVKKFDNIKQPIYIVDGVAFDKSKRMFEILKPEEIESLMVLQYGDERLAEALKGTSVTMEDVKECGACIVITLKKDKSATDNELKAKEEQDTQIAEMSKENMPKFQGGGLMDFRKWVMSKLDVEKLYKKCGKCVVTATFVIEEDGSLSDVEFINSKSPEAESAVKKVLKRSPKWEPGTVDGKAVKVRYTLPVRITDEAAQDVKLPTTK